MTSEPTSTGRECFRFTIQELLSLARDESIVTMETSTAKVNLTTGVCVFKYFVQRSLERHLSVFPEVFE